MLRSGTSPQVTRKFENKALRITPLEDGIPVHNAFFERDFIFCRPPLGGTVLKVK